MHIGFVCVVCIANGACAVHSVQHTPDNDMFRLYMLNRYANSLNISQNTTNVHKQIIHIAYNITPSILYFPLCISQRSCSYSENNQLNFEVALISN